MPLARRRGYPPAGLTATVRRTGRAARIDDIRDLPGGEPYLRGGLRSAAAMPIHVNGRLWGAIAVGSTQAPLPPDTEQRMTEFTDLIGTARSAWSCAWRSPWCPPSWVSSTRRSAGSRAS
jgi:GAF domain-containing protein